MAIEITDVDDACLWGPTVEKIFIDIMVDEVNKGNMASGQFGSKTWAKILEELQIKSKRKYLIKQIKQKFNRLRTKYREFAELLKQTGFGWDRETNTVVASEEIWQNYLRAHPKATQYRKKGCDHFVLLELIFSKSTATGQFHRSAASGPPNTDDEKEMENEFDRIDVHDIDENDSTSCSRLVDDVFKRSTKNSTTTSTERRAKRQRSQQMSDAIVAWTEVAKVRAEATLAKAEKYKSTTEGGGSQNHEFSLTNCMQILEGMEEVSDDAYMKVVEKFKDPDWREIFINMSTIRKRAWLDRL
ncbi:L10-interacting MYB domain-containing protein-like isoform X2 [Humulus lupulus]|uniref:L10-interacting MYB domain-containing protein-like isoform X2 n=1 Tax=Humulus lupulus TaxID=3486 RepID=UPI002B404439|nr:L10-interacting MYB domain-containing protein-like isoform X2 [Humulus lupulus]XP_062095057.1 L10-interacting MYB domain-containing protein-like isoform X2 [Humulus lupulus]XP_062096085.1 L10-interacting MYB domain-containing protein-like isoform X2 [Humulus lupulus]XP_062096086.1 L10-interacting MYB domain-containing protein-like isoform X2 [Humulus lupulus]